MYRIIKGKGTGKTLELMLAAKRENVPIACSNPNAMANKCKAYGLTGIDFINYQEVADCETSYMIDEIENYIKFINPKLVGYTLSEED